MQRNTYGDQFLPARRYQLSHDVSFCNNDRSSIETAGHIELVLARGGAFFYLPYYHTLCFQENRACPVSPEIRVLPFGTLSQTQDFENFATPVDRRPQRVVN